MPDQVNEPNEDDLEMDEPNEDELRIFSSLKHEFEHEELPDPVGGDLIKTIFEKRGIRSSTRRVFAHQSHSHERMLSTAGDTQYLLFMAANRHLREKGEMDFFDVASFAEQVADAEAKDLTETTSRHFRLWLETIVTKYGQLSIETAAARFIEAQDHLFTLYQTVEMQVAVFDYADAWHWLHMELFGEHELAAKGDATERSLDAGRTVQKSKGALKSALIARCYESFASTETDETKRTNAGYVAGKIIEKVNQKFTTNGFDPIAEGTLKNKLPAIIKGYRASNQHG